MKRRDMVLSILLVCLLVACVVMLKVSQHYVHLLTAELEEAKIKHEEVANTLWLIERELSHAGVIQEESLNPQRESLFASPDDINVISDYAWELYLEVSNP